ncbi:putative disease resistance protein RGA3 [Salvia hispanica]|uniref:putative disease resistance protein RGA3 n=1 Tax=Salvia hispanica TaxID=49212 RepID=UPI002009C524|nr:putative disease resistance protein RGA3 [Salvia hispanica]
MDGGAAAIEVLVQNLINVLKEDYSLLRGLDGDAQQLQMTLGMIKGYLNDAEKKFITQDAIRFWLRKLEALAFDADNVLDELNYTLLQKQVKKMKTPTVKNKTLSCFSSCKSIARRRNMAHTIKKINAEFESMSKKATNLGLQSALQNAPAAAAAAKTSIETDSISRDPIFIGRDDDVPKLVDMLTHIPQDKPFSIAAIVGMGGMGKTTLTKKVFNHESIKDRFRSLIWVHVSQTFDPISLFNKIYSTLTSNTGHRVEIKEVILKNLQEALRAKTYLLVLDDVWNEDVLKWKDFMNSMEGVTSANGNCIIITTRKEKVSSIVEPFHVHPLKGLSDNDCWSIIRENVSSGDREVPSRFENIGREIAKRCQGLPLAANVVGGVLRRCKSEEEWRSIKENWLSGDEGENISNILKLSYNQLPSPSLKKCFAYCSIFPKGRKIMKEELIELWMAEGFLQPSQNDDMESVGSVFFNVLLQSSLLQVAKKVGDETVESCVMHDLVHDLASSILSYNADDSAPVRYVFHKEESSQIPEQEAKHLRTLLLEGETSTLFSNFKCLRNLTLIGNYTKLPDSVSDLIHLRNLNISSTYIKSLPEWIGELHHLQTFRAKIWGLEILPSTFKYLINLRHLHLSPYTKLPVEIGRLSWYTKLPVEIGRLTSLQTLRHFEVGIEKGYQIEELGSLKNLKGSLWIQNLERVRDKEEATKANVLQKSNLSNLRLEWNEDSGTDGNYESVLEGLQPHANLKVLGIQGYKGKTFPTWCKKMAVRDGSRGSWVQLDNLIRITLENCSECEEIPMLDHSLPNLKYLSLIHLNKVRSINFSLKNLKNLYIYGLERLQYLPESLFCHSQSLSYLVVVNCPVLSELPDGLDTLNSLEILTISDCPNLQWIENPSRGAKKYHGILRELRIEGCGKLMELPCQILESSAPTIKILILVELRSLKNLPMLIDCLAKSSPCLEQLIIKGVPNFMASGSIESWDLGRLMKLKIDVSVEWSMENSVAIGETVEGMLQDCGNSLKVLHLKGVENWEWVPQSFQHFTALSELKLENIGVQELPQYIQHLTALSGLELENIGGEELPQSIQHLTALSWLTLKHMEIQELPQWLGNLIYISRLSLVGCKKLRCLPSADVMKCLTHLLWLEIKDCPDICIDSEWRNQSNFNIKVDGVSI